MTLTQDTLGTGTEAAGAPAADQPAVNVGQNERLISGAAGAGLVLFGLGRRSIPGLLLAGAGGALARRAYTGHCACYEALGIDTAEADRAAAQDGAAPEAYFDRGIHVEQSFTIDKPRAELYRFWRRLENLPQIFSHLESVTVEDDRASRWVCRGPLDMRYEWDAEIINDEPDALIAWRSLGGADVDNAGSVRFVDGPAGRGTQLKVVIDYIPTGGRLGKTVAALLGQNPEAQIREDLRRFKRVMEAGEAPTTDGQPRGTCLGSGTRE